MEPSVNPVPISRVPSSIVVPPVWVRFPLITAVPLPVLRKEPVPPSGPAIVPLETMAELVKFTEAELDWICPPSAIEMLAKVTPAFA